MIVAIGEAPSRWGAGNVCIRSAVRTGMRAKPMQEAA